MCMLDHTNNRRTLDKGGKIILFWGWVREVCRGSRWREMGSTTRQQWMLSHHVRFDIASTTCSQLIQLCQHTSRG